MPLGLAGPASFFERDEHSECGVRRGRLERAGAVTLVIGQRASADRRLVARHQPHHKGGRVGVEAGGGARFCTSMATEKVPVLFFFTTIFASEPSAGASVGAFTVVAHAAVEERMKEARR